METSLEESACVSGFLEIYINYKTRKIKTIIFNRDLYAWFHHWFRVVLTKFYKQKIQIYENLSNTCSHRNISIGMATELVDSQIGQFYLIMIRIKGLRIYIITIQIGFGNVRLPSSTVWRIYNIRKIFVINRHYDTFQRKIRMHRSII